MNDGLDGGSAGRLAVALLAAWAMLIAIPDPLVPGLGLDNGWVLAAERAARTGAVFGRDFVFTYGPLSVLATHLFDARTYGWVLFFDVLLTVFWLLPLFLSRAWPVMGAYAAAVLFSPTGFDARIVAALLAFAVTAVSRPGWWPLAVAAAFAPLSLSKLSFALAAVPVLLLVDGFTLLHRRRFPLATAAFLLTFAGCLVATGHPPGVWLPSAARDWQVISGYSSAMQLAIGLGGLIGLVAIVAVFALLFGWTAWVAVGRLDRRRAAWREHLPVATVLMAALWACFIGFKMGYVRADGHMLITWNVVLLAAPALVAFFHARRPLGRREALAAGALMLVVGAGGYAFAVRLAIPPTTPTAFLAERAALLVRQPLRSLGWATPARWREAARDRRRADAALARPFPASVAGTVDVIPHELSEVIASGLDYHPRPVPQSYSSYTPDLQRLDAAHLDDTRTAPRTLLFQMGHDVDYHLPTLATGPSLPVVARWYRLVGTDPLGLVLRRRAEPRPVVRRDHGVRRFALGQWVPLPPSAGPRLVMGAFEMDKNPLGRAMGLVARDPALFIDVRRPDGRVERSRFVPGMAGVGVALSPQMLGPDTGMRNARGTAGVLFPGSQPAAAPPVVAFRITGDPAAPYAFGGGKVRLWTLDVPSDG